MEKSFQKKVSYPYGFPYQPYDVQESLMNKIFELLKSEKKLGLFESPTGTVSITLKFHFFRVKPWAWYVLLLHGIWVKTLIQAINQSKLKRLGQNLMMTFYLSLVLGPLNQFLNNKKFPKSERKEFIQQFPQKTSKKYSLILKRVRLFQIIIKIERDLRVTQ